MGRIDRNSERFGEAAIDAEYLTDEKLDEILTYQSNAFMKFVQSMIDKHFLELGQINHFLDEFQRIGGYTDAQISSLIHDDLEQCVQIFVPLKSPRLKRIYIDPYPDNTPSDRLTATRIWTNRSLRAHCSLTSMRAR